MQPVNGRLLVRVITNGEYKHVNLGSDKAHEAAGSTGVVLAVAADLEAIVTEALKMDTSIKNDKVSWIPGLIKPKELVGKTVRWEKFAEQNSLFKMTDKKGKEFKAALIHYKDVIGYES